MVRLAASKKRFSLPRCRTETRQEEPCRTQKLKGRNRVIEIPSSLHGIS